MTNDQLRDLMKVLDTGSVNSLDKEDRVRSREWRREKVHTSHEITLGSFVRREDPADR